MKKIFIIALIVAVVFSAACAYADDETGMTFDNVTFGKAYKMKGYASVTLLGFKFVNMYAQWEDGKASPRITGWSYNYPMVYVSKKSYEHYADCTFEDSGTDAEFAWLKVDVTNLQKQEVNLIRETKIKVIYDDEYEYDGWIRQFNYNYSKSEVYSKNKEAGVIGWPVCLSPADEMAIQPMYKGHYAFGCTLPNFVVEDKDSPLRMEITMGENKLIYNIR
ncbi:MAG: hypothetical protein IKN30_03150 [Synergistaceae bacterium]|nr:hypothetical protein [Synergistaceae bacterium]